MTLVSAEHSHWRSERVELIDDRAVRFRDVCVHQIRMGDVEDPDVMVADAIWKWQQSAAGTWIAANCVDQPYWTRHVDYNSFGHVYRIMARLSEHNETFWNLKWGNK